MNIDKDDALKQGITDNLGRKQHCRVKGVVKRHTLTNGGKQALMFIDERTNFKLERQGNGTIINESGLYAVILRSDKPQAKPF